MLHQGETYIVNEMDLETHTVRVTETDVDYYTQPLKEVDLSIIETLETRLVQDVRCAFGEVEVTERNTGYKIKRKDTIIGVEPLDLPPITFRTKAFWIIPSADTGQRIAHSGLDLAGGLHGAEHAIIALMPLHVMCDRWDIGGLSSPHSEKIANLQFLSMTVMKEVSDLLRKPTRFFLMCFQQRIELVRDCRCDEGCPSCIYSPKCGNDNQPLDKVATALILEDLCRKPENASPVFSPAVSEITLTETGPG